MKSLNFLAEKLKVLIDILTRVEAVKLGFKRES
jgi:hypothetical protein